VGRREEDGPAPGLSFPTPPFLSPSFFLFSFFLLPPFCLILLCLETKCCSIAQTFSPNLSPPSQTWWASDGSSASPGTKQSELWVCLASLVGMMALGLLSQTLLWFLAPRRDGTRPSVSGARPQQVVNRLFFDYPDSDRASLLAVARFIGEKPITFVKTGMNQLDRGVFLLAGSGRTLLFIVWQIPVLGSSRTSWWGH
jgi:hypothetical protein